MQYIPTDLPQYWKLRQRSDFSDAVIQDGHVLLFSQDGHSIIAKLSDGSYVVQGGSNSASFDFSLTTLQQSDALAGKNFYNKNGVLVSGTIPSKGAQTYTPGTSNQVITKGQYLSDSQVILGDENLIADNIASGVSIFGVQGTHQGGSSVRAGVLVSDSGTLKVQPLRFDGTVPSDSGALEAYDLEIFETGHAEPQYGGSSCVSMDFYKCTYVSSDSSMTWRGRKAVLQNGIYVFQSDSIEGLTYTAVTPVTGQTYSGDALIRADLYEKIPTSGLVFYASLSDSHSRAYTGQVLSKTGNISYTTYKNVPCALFDSQLSYLYSTISGLTSDVLSISLWAYVDTYAGQSGGDYPRFITVGESSTPDESVSWLCLTLDKSNQAITFQSPDNSNWATSTGSVTRNQWLHLAGIFQGGSLTLYINGVASTSARTTYTLNLPAESRVNINFVNNAVNFGIDGVRLAAVRVYDKVLSQTQIMSLATEFIPTA